MTNTYTTTTVESKTAGTSSPVQEVEHIIGSIKALIAKGEKAAAKAEQFFIAAGQHLKTLKDNHAGSWAEWELLLKERVKISTGRASELMQIADGRKTVAQVRANDAEKHKRLRAAGAKSSSGRPEENDDASVEADRQQVVALFEKVKAAEQARAAATWTDDVEVSAERRKAEAVSAEIVAVASGAEPNRLPRLGWSARLRECRREVEKIAAAIAGGTGRLSDEGRDEVAHFARDLADAARALADRIERRKGEAADPRQIDIEELIAAAAPVDDGIPEFLRRTQPAGAS
jgi:hypothetical protein